MQKSKHTSFVSYYTENKISPVAQDISDIELHFQRRDSLFRSLGVPPLFVQDRNVLEFGPGSGHNSLYTASLKPATYELVDANPTGLENTKSMLNSYGEIDIKIHDSLFMDFKTEKKFDLVWAENCIPGQDNPLEILQHVAKFVKPNGILVITLTNGISILSECFRRLIYHKFLKSEDSVLKNADKMVSFYEHHTKHLAGMSRSTKDWILDNITQPLHDRKMLSLPEVVEAEGNKFDLFYTSPKFVQDMRWYKEVVGQNRLFNELALKSYYKTNLNLIDRDLDLAPHNIELGKKIEKLSSDAWDMSCECEKDLKEANLSSFLAIAAKISNLLPKDANATIIAIQEATNLLGAANLFEKRYPSFEKWWGRGTQYISLIKK
jgi:SAM-dependent methyltransferase